jgi:PIN domain nuclease of toxin-antitoxin system
VKVLLDTHTLLWWFADDPALPRQAELLIDANELGGRR